MGDGLGMSFDDGDMSGELISIEDTYKEVQFYRQSGSGSSNTALTAAAQQIANFKESSQPSDGLKKSMTVIQEEDLEESALVGSYLAFNSSGGRLVMRPRDFGV